MNSAQKREITILKSKFGGNVSTHEEDGRLTVAVILPKFNKTLSVQIDQKGDAFVGLHSDIAVELTPYLQDLEDMLGTIKPEYLDNFVDHLNQGM